MTGTPYALYVTLLGGFSIRLVEDGQDHASDDPEPAAAPLRQRNFLQYLCVYHDRPVTQEEVTDALLDSETQSGDPTGTLKNNLYRARLLLEELGLPDGKSLLRYRQGVYTWAPEVNITLDVEVFDELYDKFYTSGETPDLEAGLEALKLYQGDFLPSASSSLWTLSIRTYYHSRYLKLARDVAGALYEQGDTETGIELCRAATSADPFDEDTQLLMMKLLHAAGLTQAAIQHYEAIRTLFMDQLGISPSQPLADFYRSLDRTNGPRETDLKVIRGQLLEDGLVDGAYFCEYSVFQNMYRLIARSTLRSGQAIQLAMTILCDPKGQPLPVKHCAEAMGVLHESIHRVLRAGDIFTRFSRDQYLIMLPSSSHENACMALERVLSNYRTTLSGMTTQVQYSVLPVLPPKVSENTTGTFFPTGRRT